MKHNGRGKSTLHIYEIFSSIPTWSIHQFSLTYYLLVKYRFEQGKPDPYNQEYLMQKHYDRKSQFETKNSASEGKELTLSYKIITAINNKPSLPRLHDRGTNPDH